MFQVFKDDSGSTYVLWRGALIYKNWPFLGSSAVFGKYGEVYRNSRTVETGRECLLDSGLSPARDDSPNNKRGKQRECSCSSVG